MVGVVGCGKSDCERVVLAGEAVTPRSGRLSEGTSLDGLRASSGGNGEDVPIVFSFACSGDCALDVDIHTMWFSSHQSQLSPLSSFLIGCWAWK